MGVEAGGLLLERVPPQLPEAIALLARPHTGDELQSLLPALDPRWWRWLLDRLGDTGLLVPAPPTPEPSLPVVGGGPLAEAVTAALCSGGLPARRVDPVAFAALASPLERPELVVLAGPTAEPDRATTDALFRDGRTHLVVRAEPDRAVVGPLVQPGASPCVRCQDLTRVRLDPAWPGLLAQLCREPVVAEPALVGWAAATAAVQVRAWLAGGSADTTGGSLELDLTDFRLRTRRWPAHPACGCLVPLG